MDVNFSNVLEGTRQYFQGLPKASPNSAQSQNESPTAAAVRPFWSEGPPGPSAALPAQPARFHSEEGSLAQSGSPTMANSRPPSVAAAHPSPAPPQVPLPFRPPSEPLLEPEAHIIHKATVMQQAQAQAQQKQQSYLNPSRDLERPPSINMISPPTHIIHKPQRAPPEQPQRVESEQRQDRRTPKEEPRIPPHFAVTEGGRYPPESIVPRDPSPVHPSKYYSHLPTPPPPSSYPNRTQAGSQQRTLTVLQARHSYQSSTYPKDTTVSSNGKISQKSPYVSSSQSSEMYARQQYETVTVSGSSPADAGRSSSVSDLYLNSAQMTPMAVQSSQKTHRPAPVQYSRPQSYRPPQNHPDRPPPPEREKSSGTLTSVRHYPQTVPHQKSRAVPVSKSSSVGSSQAQTGQHQYNQRLVPQQMHNSSYPSAPREPVLYASHQNHSRVPDPPASDGSPSRLSSGASSHDYNYARRLPSKNVTNHLPAGPASNYHERIPVLNTDQRHPSLTTLATQTHSGRSAPHPNLIGDSSHHYPRVPPAPSQHPVLKREYHPSPPLKSHLSTSGHHYGSGSTSHRQYSTVNSVDHTALSGPSGSNSVGSSGYQTQAQYRQVPPVIKHSYDTSPKHGAPSRTFPPKPNLVAHQPRPTVSVTSLVTQMNVMRQQSTRPESAGAPLPKHRKESPLDLSVKTVRIPADSTAQDDTENAAYEKREAVLLRGNVANASIARDLPAAPPNMVNQRPRYQSQPEPVNSHKVDFLPNFNTQNPNKAAVQRPYGESAQPYMQNATPARYERGYPETQSGVPPSSYANRAPSHSDVQQSYATRYETAPKQTYTNSTDYGRRVEQSLPKIDLTINLDDYERDHRRSAQTYQREESRKREAGRIPSSIPHKSSRYEFWNVDRHGRPEAMHSREINASAVPTHYKAVNGTDLATVDRRKPYDNHVYAKKSENVEPLPSKYYHGHIQQTQSQPEVFYQKVSNYQHLYEYNPPEKLPQPPPTKQELHTIQQTTPADKRVLSILRNSLEARNYADNQKATDSSDDCVVIPSDDTVPSGDFSEYQSKKAKHMIEHRSSLASLSNENSSTNVSYKVQMPRAVDSIKYDSDSSLKSIRIRDDLQSKPVPVAKDTNEIAPNVNESPGESISPTELDIAAVLAARIRTKAELKGFTQSNSNACSAKPKVPENNIEVKDSDAPSNVSKVVPPTTHRRRLFSKTESDSSVVNETRKDLPAIRSSSDSCIFDFQDSGSEGEKPISEKVPLELVSKENLSDIANVDKTLLLVKSEEKTVPEDDPKWAEACDNFLEQLKTGKMKKARRRNTPVIREKSEPLLKDNLIDSIKIEKSVIVNVVDIVKSDKTSNLFMKKIKQEVKDSEVNSPIHSDSSDEDQPLINRKVKKEKEDKLKNTQQVPSDIDFNWKSAVIKIENTVDIPEVSKKNKTSKPNSHISDSKHHTDKSSSDDERLIVKKRKQEILKNEISNSESSDSDSDELIVATRSKTRKSVSSKGGEGKLSKSPTKESLKMSKEDSSKLKKQVFGDGSDFHPGWEEEVYKFKQSLRMPPRLINVTRPPHWPRVSTSLPDLDPYPNSPAPSTSTEELYTKKYALNIFDGNDKSKLDMDSDSESMSSYSINHKPNYDSEASCSTVMSMTDKKVKNKAKQDNNSSIIDLLIQKCGKKEIRKKKNKDDSNVPKMIPKSTNPSELLATPSLSLEKDSLKKGVKGVAKSKVTEESYLGSFRKQTISTFRAAFISNTDGLLGATEEFSPVVMKSRTRTETRVLKQRATIKEVFGDERPASAPPVSCRAEEEEEEPAPVVQIKVADIKNKIILKKKMKKCLSVAREGLRSSRLKRSDAKGRLLRIKKRNNFLKSLSSKKLKNSTTIIHKVKKEETESGPGVVKDKDNEDVAVPEKKRFRKLFTRRKFSSGFDYIRKKKKLIKKEDGHKRKRGILSRPSPESVHDIQREIKNWIINKSVGETVLHRAARLGFTDCVAYCLEKLDVPPSCRDNAGYTALHEACSRGHLDIAKLLLQYGANVSEAAQGGIRPLHEACENGFIEIIRLLLSYGADPLLATYSGQTPISLSGGKAARLLQLHLNDVQGNVPQPWHFNGPCKLLDPVDSGYDAVAHPPIASSPAPQHQIELISASTPLPPLYRLKPTPHTSTSNSDSERSSSSSDSGLWCLLQDLAALLQVKSRDALLKQIHCGPGPPRDSLKELRMQEFLDRAQCQQLMSAGEKINIRASKIALVRYTDKVKQLLNTETVVVR